MQEPDDRFLYAIYRNWRGEVDLRRIQPMSIKFDTSKWHPEPQWLLHAYDADKRELRMFALRNFLTLHVSPDHPARCDAQKWAVMREALNTQVAPDAVQPLPQGGGEPVFPKMRELLESMAPQLGSEMQELLAGVIDKTRAREAYGINKYKQTLMTQDGRLNAKDCEDEALDFAVYLVKAAMQGEDLKPLARLLGLLVRLLHTCERRFMRSAVSHDGAEEVQG